MLTAGAAQVVEMALQLAVPIVLVRVLSPHDFGIYRVVWLIVMSIAAVTPMGMVESLFYFLPRLRPEERLAFIRQTEFYLIAGSTAVIGTLFLVRAALPPTLQEAVAYALPLALLTVGWLWGFLLDLLPTIDERIKFQAAVSIALSVTRAAAVTWAGWHYGRIEPILIVLTVLALVKVTVLQWYIRRRHPGRTRLQARRLMEQLRYAVPAGAGEVLFVLRRQSEQWIAAALFTAAQYAAFSIAAVLAPLIFVARKSVAYVLLPRMNRSHAEGRLDEVLQTNHQVNEALAFVLYPTLAFAFVHARDLVTLVYTREFVAAADVMRVMIVGWAVQSIDFQSLVLVFRQQPYVARVNSVLLVVSVPLSLVGAQLFGLPGVAMGSALTMIVERSLVLRRLAGKFELPVARFQPWRRLAIAAATAIACAGASGLAAELSGASGTAARLSIGAGVFVVTYGVAAWLVRWARRRGPPQR